MMIKLGRRRVLGIVSGDLFEVEVALDADGLVWPDEEWLTLFREYGSFPGDLEEPRLEHGKLRFEASEQDLARAWHAIDQRVHATNQAYEAELAPRDRTARRTESIRRDDVDRRIEDAQSLLDSLESMGP